jgi:hypothetical protein
VGDRRIPAANATWEEDRYGYVFRLLFEFAASKGSSCFTAQEARDWLVQQAPAVSFLDGSNVAAHLNHLAGPNYQVLHRVSQPTSTPPPEWQYQFVP